MLARQGRRGLRAGLWAVPVLLLALGLPLGSATPLSAPPGTPWAYAGNSSVSTTVGVSGPQGGNFSVQGSFGTAATFLQTNGTEGNYTVNANSTVGFVFNAFLCASPCLSSSPSVQLIVHAWQREEAVLNLTDRGSVRTAAGAVGADSILSSHLAEQENLTEVLSWRSTPSGPLEYVYRTAQIFLTVDLSFGYPGLGITPTSLTSGESWNSSVPASLRGSYHTTCFIAAQTTSSFTSEDCGPGSGTFNAPASFSLTGRVVGTGWVSSSQSVVQSVSSTPSFDLVDGFFLTPRSTDLFGDVGLGTTLPSPYQQVGTSALAWLGSAGHLGLVASTTVFSPHLPGSQPTDSGLPLPTATPEVSGLGSYAVEAKPTSTQQATNQSCSLAPGCTGITPSPTPVTHPGSPFPWGWVGLGVAVLAVAVIAVVVAVGRRPRAPIRTPPSEEAASGEVLPPLSEAAEEDDPLGRLW